MVGVEELSENLACRSSLPMEGVSVTMQDADATLQPIESAHASGIDMHTPSVNTRREDVSMEQGLIKNSSAPATEKPAPEHHTDVEVDNHSSKDIELLGSAPQGVDHIIENIYQQMEENTVDHTSQSAVVSSKDKDAGKIADGSAEHYSVNLGGDGVQQLIEEMSIQEDELLKTVSEVLEARHLIETRPLPVLVKGKEVDLLKLCVQVRACGGYDNVTSWASISKSLGFAQELGPLLKLVYVKYLKALENRRLVASQGVQSSKNVSKREIEASPVIKLQAKGRGAVMATKKKTNEEVPAIENSPTDNSLGMSLEGSESLAGVLEWVKRLALNPGDPKKGQGVRVSRWSEAWAGKCETLAGRVRAVLWRKGEQPLHDSSPPESQDQAHERKKRGRASIASVSAHKSRRLSS